MTSFRAFIAFDLPSSLREEVADMQAQLAKWIPNPNIRWLPIENIHLTIKFLGEIEESKVPAISQKLRQSLSFVEQIAIQLKEPSLFPYASRPRGIWLTLHFSLPLSNYAIQLDRQLNELAFPMSKRPFSPHLTIARFRRGIQKSELRMIDNELSTIEANPLQSISLSGLVLYQSELHPDGAQYRKRFVSTIKQ